MDEIIQIILICFLKSIAKGDSLNSYVQPHNRKKTNMKRNTNRMFSRAAMTLLLMLLTTVTAWAIKTETPVSYTIQRVNAVFSIKVGNKVTDSWTTNTEHWAGEDSHRLANDMTIKPNATVAWVSTSQFLQTLYSTTFTFTAPSNIAITGVTFQGYNGDVSVSSHSEPGTTYTVTLAEGTYFNSFVVTYAYISGSCGTNATWTLNKQNGQYTALTIGGSGAMNNYGYTTVDELWRTDAPWDWQDLKSVTIGNSITSIGNYAFIGCQQLSSLTIGTGVTTIGTNAFDHCDALTQVTLPASVSSIGDGGFRNCVGLTRVNIERTSGLATLGSNAFYGCAALQYIVAPTPELALQYKTASNWSSYAAKKVVEFGGYFFSATDEGGTAAYAITNETDLRNLASAVNDENNPRISEGKTFRQTANITLGSTNFEPIGKSSLRYFIGTYDGGNYTISGLNVGTLTEVYYYGLFGYVRNATVKNVRLVNPTVSDNGSGLDRGALIGGAGGSSTVENCVVINPTIQGDEGNKGAIIGYNYGIRTLRNLYFYGGNLNNAVDNNGSGTNVGRARKVTIGSGISSVTPAATDMANGFVYNNERYYREGLELTLASNLSATGKHPVYSANNTALNGNTYTVNSTDGDVTFTAELVYNSYTVHFDKNHTDATGSMSNQDFTYGTAQNLTANAFSRTGYTFAGWATSDNGAVVYADKASVSNLTATNGGTVTLYAKWTANTYSVQFNGNGNTGGSMSNQDFTYGTAKSLTANSFTRAFTVTYNYNGATGGNSQTSAIATATFNGWAETASGAKVYNNQQSVNNLTTTNNGTFNLYAKWTDDGSVTLPTPVKTGYTFAGWYSDAGLTAKVGDAGASYTPSADIPLYAKWTANTYTVQFNGNGHTGGSMSNQDFTYDAEPQNLTANSFTRALTVTYNYNGATGGNGQTSAIATATFAGWAETASGEKVYNNQQSVNNLTATNNGTFDLYAKWTDGSVTLPTPVKTGYTFVGWYSDAGLTDKVGNAGDSYTPSADITLYAKWGIPYIDADGNTQVCANFTVLTNETDVSDLGGGWYVVMEDVSYSSRFNCVEGDIHLILCDGAKMTVKNTTDDAIVCIEKRGSLTIYAQSTGSSMGQLETSCISITHDDFTICGGQVYCNELYAFDNFIIYDGRITVRNDKEDRNGIRSHNVTIHGGQVSATGTYSGIFAYETLTLGLRNATDYIYASSYYTDYDFSTENDEAIISVKDGQTLTDGTSTYSGSLGQELSGRTFIRVDVLEDAATNDVAALAIRLDGKQTNILLNGRTLYKEGWNTICLPFDVDLTTEGPLKGATAKTLSNVANNGSTLTLTFGEAVTQLVAGTPYIVKLPEEATENLVNPIFKGVTISNELHEVEAGDGTFKGTYARVDWSAGTKNALFLQGNKFYYPASAAYVNAFRAYIQLKNDAPVSAGANIIIDFGDDNATGIEVVETDAQPSTVNSQLEDVWYTLQGIPLDSKPTEKGIYILNGKKVAIK